MKIWITKKLIMEKSQLAIIAFKGVCGLNKRKIHRVPNSNYNIRLIIRSGFGIHKATYTG
jgi:hypothetical protein